MSDLRKFRAIGTGVGIEIGRSDLNAVVVRVRPRGTHVLGTLTIDDYRGQPAAEWGAA